MPALGPLVITYWSWQTSHKSFHGNYLSIVRAVRKPSISIVPNKARESG